MKIALAQIDNTYSIEKNIEKIITLVNDYEADYYVFPESCITGYSSKPERINAISLEDERLQTLVNVAREKNCHIFAGANIVSNGKNYIAYLHINEKIDTYYKTHLGIKESGVFSSGTELKVFNASIPTGITICIESHFPDVAQSLRLKGAEIILVPFASPKVCGGRKKLWHKYLTARAYDNQVFLFATNLTGKLDGLTFSGGMIAVDPRGNTMYENYEDSELVKVIEIDESVVAKSRGREKLNYIDRRRPDLYV